MNGEVNERTHHQDQCLYNQNTDTMRNISINCEEDEGDHVITGGYVNPPPRKKLCFSKEQSALLEESSREHHTLNPVNPNMYPPIYLYYSQKFCTMYILVAHIYLNLLLICF